MKEVAHCHHVDAPSNLSGNLLRKRLMRTMRGY
jgi:hypothetical protein